MIRRERSVLCVIDMQGSLFRVMNDNEALLANTLTLINGARVLGIPIITTEQVKLGETLREIADHLPEGEIIVKETFSCLEHPRFNELLGRLQPSQVILAGIEAHICVYQTAIGLKEADYEVYVAGDCVSSRRASNKEIALCRMAHEGIRLTTAEMVLFELLKTAADPQARDIFRIVK